MLGSLLSAGVGLLGSIFGGKKKQTVTSEVDYQKMVRNAEAANINPLTALRNGGSHGFTTTTSPSVSTLPDVLGNLGGVLGDALEKKLDPFEAKKRERDTALVDYQLRQLKQGPQFAGRLYQPLNLTGTQVSQQFVPRVGTKKTTEKVAAAAKTYGKTGLEEIRQPMRITLVDDDGTEYRVANPDGPEIENLLVPEAVQGVETVRKGGKAVIKEFSGDKIIRKRDLTKAEKKREEEKWHGGWLPSIGLKWN